MTIQNVALVGANGHLGPFILKALLDSKSFSVTVISRASSTSKYSPEVKVAPVGDDLPHADLVKALQGQDAVITAFSGNNTEQGMKFIDAAIDAHVKVFIPADFGSCDSSDPRTFNLIPLYKGKTEVRHYLQAREDQISWISLVTGHFFDYGLKSGLLAVDVPKRKMRVFDGGDIPFSTSPLDAIGIATAKVLQHADELKNKMVYIHSISTTQNKLKKALEEVTGSTFEVEHVSSDDWIQKHKTILVEKGWDHDTIEELVTVEGIVNADWRNKKTFANELLNMPQETEVELLRRLEVQ